MIPVAGLRRIDNELRNWALLAVMPIAVFLLMRVQPMARVMSVDPTFYTGYITNGPDLIARYGTDRYFWSRVGMVVPARIMHELFGPVAGFYVLRYAFALLAIGSAYLLFRRTWTGSSGLLAALVVLVNPVVLRAWTSDYPDGAIITYLLAGTCFLLMPSPSRLRWVVGSGICFTLAIHSNLFAASLVIAIVAGHWLVMLQRDGIRTSARPAATEGALLAAVVVVGSLALAVLAEVIVGAGNLLHPNLIVLREVRAGLLDAYHSSNWRWSLRETQLWVVPLYLTVWVVMRRFSASRSSRQEGALVLIAALQLVGFGAWQFLNHGQTLENHLYASWLWSGGSLLAAVVVVRIWSDSPRALGAGMAAGAVVAVPLATRSLAADLHFLVWPWAVLILGGTVVVVASAAVVARHREWTGRTLQTLAVVTSAYLLTVGKPQGLPQLPGQARQPQASYGDVFLNADDEYLEQYRIITSVPSFVPAMKDQPGRLLTWWSGDSPDLVQNAAAMYLWRIHAVTGFDFESPGLPDLTPGERAGLLADPPRFILLLGADEERFPAAITALRSTGLRADAGAVHTIRSGESELAMQLVELRAH